MITILGASKGVGKLFHDYLVLNEVPSVDIHCVSREQGIDLNDNKEYKHAIELCADSDIVFNNAPASMQYDIVNEVIYETDDVMPKDWIHVGSQLTDIIANPEGYNYIYNKQKLADLIRSEINKYGLSAPEDRVECVQRHCLLSLGAVETNQIEEMFNRLSIPMIDRAYMFSLFNFMMECPKEYCLGEIRLIPDQFIDPECYKDFEFRRHTQKYTK